MRILGRRIYVNHNQYRTKYFSVDPNKMIEMDRFVVRLKRSAQTLVRQSRESLATMKELGGTLEK